MAKQVINIGSAANDGTGDPIRTAWTKANANFTELYDSTANLFDGKYSSLTGAPTIPSKLTDLGISDGANNSVLTTDGNGTFTFKVGAAGINLTDLSVATANTGTAALAYNNSTGVFTFTPPNLSGYALTSAIPTTILDLGIADGANNQVLSTDGAGNFTFVDQSGGGGVGLSARTTKTGTTVSLADAATGDLDIAGFKGYALLAIQTSAAAWVRIYANGAARTADASRLETVDPLPDAGVIAEVITTGAQTVLISPGTIGYNFESTPTTNIPCAVTNKSGSTGAVTVTLTVIQLEA